MTGAARATSEGKQGMNTIASETGAAASDELLETICSHLAPLNKVGITLNAETDIAADLEVDSVAVMDLVMTIEDAYDIMIPMNRLSEVRTVGDLAQTVRTLIEKE
jgi:acyl carrier protein